MGALIQSSYNLMSEDPTDSNWQDVGQDAILNAEISDSDQQNLQGMADSFSNLDWSSQGLSQLSSMEMQNLESALGVNSGLYAALARSHSPGYAANTMSGLAASKGINTSGTSPSSSISGQTSPINSPSTSGSTSSSSPSRIGAGPAPINTAPVVRTEGIPGGTSSGNSALGNLGGLLGLSDRMNQGIQPFGTNNQQQQINTPGFVSNPNVIPNQSNNNGSFGSLLSQSQPNQVSANTQSQPINQVAQDLFSSSGSLSPSDPAFKSETKGKSSTGGSSFGNNFIPPSQATPQDMQNPNINRFPATTQGSLPGAIGGVPAVSNQPGIDPLGMPVPGVNGSQIQPQGTFGAQGDSPTNSTQKLPLKKESSSFSKVISDPDGGRISMSSPSRTSPVADFEFNDPDGGSISLGSKPKTQAPPVMETKQVKPTQKNPNYWTEKNKHLSGLTINSPGIGTQLGKTAPFVESLGQGATNSMVGFGGAIMHPFRSDEERAKVNKYLEQENADLDYKLRKNPIQSALGRTIGEIAPFLLTPGKGIFKGFTAGKRMLDIATKGFLTGGLMGASQPAGTAAERGLNTLVGTSMATASRFLSPFLRTMAPKGGKLLKSVSKITPQALLSGAGALYGYHTGDIKGAVVGGLTAYLASKGLGKGAKYLSGKLASVSKAAKDTATKEALGRSGALLTSKGALSLKGENKSTKVMNTEQKKINSFSDPDDKKRVDNFSDPNSVKNQKEADKRATTPMVKQVPKRVVKAVETQSRGEAEKQLATEVLNMSPDEFHKEFLSTGKKRNLLRNALKKYGRSGDLAKFDAMLRKMDGAEGPTPVGLMRSIEEKTRQTGKLTRKQQSLKNQIKQGVSQKQLAKNQEASMQGQVQRRIAQRQVQRKGPFHRFEGFKGNAKTARTARIMKILLSYLLRNSGVQRMLQSPGANGDLARSLLPEIQNKIKGM